MRTHTNSHLAHARNAAWTAFDFFAWVAVGSCAMNHANMRSTLCAGHALRHMVLSCRTTYNWIQSMRRHFFVRRCSVGLPLVLIVPLPGRATTATGGFAITAPCLRHRSTAGCALLTTLLACEGRVHAPQPKCVTQRAVMANG